MGTPAAHRPGRLPPPLFKARCRACWLVAGVLVLVVASFASLDLHLASFVSGAALASMGRFLAEFVPPDFSAPFVRSVAVAAWETLAMSALGTLLAAGTGVLLALPASRLYEGDAARGRGTRVEVRVTNEPCLKMCHRLGFTRGEPDERAYVELRWYPPDLAPDGKNKSA